MTDSEVMQARVQKLEMALADYIARYGLSEVARKAMVGVTRSPHRSDTPADIEG